MSQHAGSRVNAALRYWPSFVDEELSALSIVVMQPLYIVIWCHIRGTGAIDQRNDDAH